MRLSAVRASLLLFGPLIAGGCSRAPVPTAAAPRDAVKPAFKAPSSAIKPRTHTEPLATDTFFPPLKLPADSAAAEAGDSTAAAATARAEDSKAGTKASLADIDEARAAAAGIRKLTGRHLALFTDVPAGPSVDDLPAVFDAAFPQWCAHLGLHAVAHGDWRMRGYLIQDRERFEAAGLWPADVPQFVNGYTRGREFWLYNQSSDYYRRHLMLHEGVHGIMFTLQRSRGPAWYMEGLAELLATHRWSNGRLTLPHFPEAPADVPKLGRIEIVQTQFKAGRANYLRDVLALENANYLDNVPYAWSWAAAAFLYGHPAYRERFRAMLKHPAHGDFNERFKQAYAADAHQLAEEWQIFIGELAHGYDFKRTQLDFSPATAAPQKGKPATASIAADRGWQNIGLRLAAGNRYHLAASGRYTLATEPKPWISEPNGVTIRYHRGLPLGILLAVVRPEEGASGQSAFFNPQVIGLGATIEPKQTGTLYLRINDFAGELADNSGAAEVKVTVE